MPKPMTDHQDLEFRKLCSTLSSRRPLKERAEAARHLAEYKSRAVEPLLSCLCNDPSNGVGDCAADSLIMIGKASVEPLWKRFQKSKSARTRRCCISVLNGLAKFTRSYTPQLLDSLYDEDATVRGQVAYLLCRSRAPAATVVAPLLNAFRSEEEPSTQECMINALSLIAPQDPRVIKSFIELLKHDPDCQVRYDAALGLAKTALSKSDSFHALLGALRDDEEFLVREGAAIAFFGENRSSYQICIALGFLFDLEYPQDEKIQAIDLLARRRPKHPFIRAAIKEMAKVDDPEVRTHAKAVFRRLSEKYPLDSSGRKKGS